MERSTRQRQAIRDALAAADRPLSPQEILLSAGKRVDGLGMATVYRTIKSMTEHHQIAPVELPGEPARYELAGKDHHHHFSCRACNKVYEVEGCPGDLSALTPPGFEADAHEVILYGRCAACVTGPTKPPRRARPATHKH